jgi:hypothetical protein
MDNPGVSMLEQMQSNFVITGIDGLNIALSGGQVSRQSRIITIPDSAFPLTPAATNYIYVDRWFDFGLGLLSTGFPSRSVPLWEVITDGVGVIGIVDRRSTTLSTANSGCELGVDTVGGVGLINVTGVPGDTGWLDYNVGFGVWANATWIRLEVRVTEHNTPGAASYCAFCHPDDRLGGLLDDIKTAYVIPQVSGLRFCQQFVIPVKWDAIGAWFSYRFVPDISLLVPPCDMDVQVLLWGQGYGKVVLL